MSTSKNYEYLIEKFVSTIVNSTTIGRFTNPIRRCYQHQEIHGIVQSMKDLNREAVVVLKTDHNASIPNGNLIEIPIRKLFMDHHGKILFAHEPPVDLLTNTVRTNQINFSQRFLE